MIKSPRVEEVKRGIRNCAKMEVEKFKYSLKKKKYMKVKTGKENKEVITEKVKVGVIQKVEKY